MANTVADHVTISYPKLWESERGCTPAGAPGGGRLWE